MNVDDPNRFGWSEGDIVITQTGVPAGSDEDDGDAAAAAAEIDVEEADDE